jgi:predicted RNase H-like nuclease (RuvC/YqgF family)
VLVHHHDEHRRMTILHRAPMTDPTAYDELLSENRRLQTIVNDLRHENQALQQSLTHMAREFQHHRTTKRHHRHLRWWRR